MYIVPSQIKSWLEVPANSHFPIQNIPLGVATIDDDPAVVTRIGDNVINVTWLVQEGYLDANDAVLEGELLMDPADATEMRRILVELFEESNRTLREDRNFLKDALYPLMAVEMEVPMPVAAYVDFYSGIHHASNVGRMFRPDQPPLLPNYRHIPIGYHGRASSIEVSGSEVMRPWGHILDASTKEVLFKPTEELDFELELGYFIGENSKLGIPIPIEQAEEAILGYVLVNDWSARDVQRFEYQPLGPFLAKSFITSVSPWVVLKDALEPFRTQGMVQDPMPSWNLRSSMPQHYNIQLEVSLQTQAMKRPQLLSVTDSLQLYWSPAQQVAHMASNGTPVEAGDLYATGTISSEANESNEGNFGSLLELTWRGTKPLKLDETGETRTFLQDGDTVFMSGKCTKNGLTIGFGEVSGTVVAALDQHYFLP